MTQCGLRNARVLVGEMFLNSLLSSMIPLLILFGFFFLEVGSTLVMV